MHLFLSVNKGTCAMEKCKNRKNIKTMHGLRSTTKLRLFTPPKEKSEGVNDIILIKEEPPDLPQQANIQGELNGEIKHEIGDFTNNDATISRKHKHCINYSMLIK